MDLSVYDAKGRKITTLVDENLNKGNYSIVWNGTNSNGQHQASGIYFVKLTCNDIMTTQKISLIK